MQVKCGSCGGGELVLVDPVPTADGYKFRCSGCGRFLRIKVDGAKIVGFKERKPRRQPPRGNAEWRTFHARLSVDAHAVVRRALRAAAILAGDHDLAAAWAALALERIAADFLAGVPREVLAQVEAEDGPQQ